MHGGREHRGMTYRSCGRFNRFNGQRKTSVGSHAESRVHTGRAAGERAREIAVRRCSVTISIPIHALRIVREYRVSRESQRVQSKERERERKNVYVCEAGIRYTELVALLM